MGASMNHTGQRSRRRRGSFTEINVTPFVDVMLVLLVIFMVTAPMLTAGVEVDLPDTKAAPLKGQDEPLVISVQKSGALYIQNDAFDLQDLQPKLVAIAGENKEKRVIVRADGATDYKTVMVVMGEINSAGFSKIALETDIAAGK